MTYQEKWSAHQHPKQPNYWFVNWGPFKTGIGANSDTAEQEINDVVEFLNSDGPTAQIISRYLLRSVAP